MNAKSILAMVILLIMAGSLSAKDVTGRASVKYKSFNTEFKQQAINKARAAAWKRYTAGFPSSKKSVYFRIKNEFDRRMDDVIVEEVIVQEKRDKNNKTYKVALRLTIDDSAVDSIFNDMSAAGSQALGMASDFGNIFIARLKMSSKNYDTRRVNVSESQSEDSLEHHAASGGGRMVDAAGTRSFSRTATGGSKTRKRSAETYELDGSFQEDLAGIMVELLSDAGFEPMEYMDLMDYGAPDIDFIYEETTEKGKLKAKSLKRIKGAAIDAGWSYLGYGTVDLDLPHTDGATGLYKVAGKVNYRVWMITNGRAKNIARVRATQVYGLGETEEYASTEALNKAAEKAIQTVVAQLQKKGVR